MPTVTDENLRASADIFTMVWLSDYVEQTTNAMPPRVRNSDGDELMFHTARFPVVKGIRQKDIAERLNRIATLSPAGAKVWNWLETPVDDHPAERGDGLSLDSTMDDGIRVLGTVELIGRTLLFSANSPARAEKGMALLQGILGDLVGPPLTEIQTLDQMMAEGLSEPAEPHDELDLSPEVMTRFIHDTLDKAYRKTLDEPVGTMGGLTPRQAVKTAAGRRKAAEWLKYLENLSAQYNSPGDPMETYSFLWMWEELGIADLRQ
jgi:hypothetical protein